MKKKRMLAVLMVGLVLLSGCSVKSSNDMDKEITNAIKKDKAYRNIVKNTHAEYRREAFSINNKIIDVGFYKKPVSDAMREVAQMLKIGFDESFIPSREYRITIEHRGSLGSFLEQVKQSTGVSYKYRQNVLKVVNKQLIKKDNAEKVCKIGQKPTISISLQNVEPMQIFKYFSKKYGYNFVFKTKYYSIDGFDNKKEKVRKTSLFYTGCDAKEALYSFLSAIDFVGYEVDNKKFKIQDYKMETIDIPTYFDYKYMSGQTLGETNTNVGTNGSTVSVSENGKEEFKTYIKNFMNPRGVLNISNRGYLTIIDRPQKVDEIKRIIQTEIQKQTPMELSLSIVRITLNDGLETGVDFNFDLSSILGELSGQKAFFGTGDYTQEMTQGMVIQGTKAGLPIIFKALKQLGNTKVVREYNVKTRNGILSTFRAVDRIPYVTTSTIASASTTETATEAKFATSGIIINVLPQLTENQETVNMSTDILISEYLGDKIFNTAQGELKLPQITENEIQVPVSIKMGESAILTGFNLREDSSTRSGIPTGIEQNLYYTERLFGNFNDANKASQLVVIITPKKIEDF